MKYRDLENKLFEYSNYRVVNKNKIDFEKKYTLFTFIIYNNNVQKVYSHTLKEENELLEFSKSNSIYNYIDSKLNNYLTNKCKADINKIRILTYLIPIDEDRIFNFFFSIQESINNPLPLFTLYNHLKKFYKIYTLIVTFYMFIYGAYISLILSSIGITIEALDDISTIFTLISYLIIGTLSGFPLYLLYEYLDINEMILYIWIGIIVFFIIYSLMRKTRYTNITSKIIIYIPRKILELVSILYLWILAFCLLVVALIPMMYIYDLLTNDTKSSTATTMFYEYYNLFTSYPKVLTLKNKTYIIVGNNKVTYLGFENSNILDKMGQKYSEDYKDICTLINNKKINETKIIFKILSNSTYSGKTVTHPIISTRVKGLKFSDLTLNNMGISFKSIEKNCHVFKE